MENQEAVTRVGRAIVPEPEGMICRIHNPGKRARVIYDGIKNDKPIHIAPGQTLEKAVLSAVMIDRLQDEAKAASAEEPELQVAKLGGRPRGSAADSAAA